MKLLKCFHPGDPDYLTSIFTDLYTNYYTMGAFTAYVHPGRTRPHMLRHHMILAATGVYLVYLKPVLGRNIGHP